MKLLRINCKVETVKITDDYPPGINPVITYGIHRTLMDAIILLSCFNNFSILKIIDKLLYGCVNWRVDFPMKGGLIDIVKCPWGNSEYIFSDWFQRINHSIENKRSSGPKLGWDNKNGIELSNYEVRFLKDISSNGKEDPKSSYEGYSKGVTIEYLKYIREMCKSDRSEYHFQQWQRGREYRHYLWKYNRFLNDSPWLIDIYNLCRSKFKSNEFKFKRFNSILTFTHNEKRILKKLLYRSKFHIHNLHESKLDKLNLSKSRLNFTKIDSLCPDIMEIVGYYYDKIVITY